VHRVHRDTFSVLSFWLQGNERSACQDLRLLRCWSIVGASVLACVDLRLVKWVVYDSDCNGASTSFGLFRR